MLLLVEGIGVFHISKESSLCSIEMNFQLPFMKKVDYIIEIDLECSLKVFDAVFAGIKGLVFCKVDLWEKESVECH